MSSAIHSSKATHRLRVGDLARTTGKTVRAIHLYEEMGLLHPVSRSSGGFRLYDDRAIDRVRWIDLLHGLGFSLHEMRDMLKSWWNSELGPDAMDELRPLFERKLEEARAAIERYQNLERELKKGLAYLETCRVCATRESVNGCVHCRQDHGMEGEPALVAGITVGNEMVRPRGPREGLIRVEDVGRRGERE
jgi:MerR family transcriptional regulator, copper efflux regulator